MHELWSSEEMSCIPDSYYLPSIKFHFYAMSCQLSHEKRSFLAEELVKLLLLLDKPNTNNSKQQDNLTQVESEPKQKLTEEEPDPDDIPFKAGDTSRSSRGIPDGF
ncbi:hypothetical protein [Nostoc sp.]|uniref:hypothetical protein n=1 Tax=Nostoc sp. TaxID=1180 RepID=UPI002FFC3D20